MNENKHIRLLILDDDPLICRTIENIAQYMGYTTRATTNPELFLRTAKNWQPQVIVLDLIMPNMDGIQVLNRLAKESCEAKILITSGLSTRILDAAERTATAHGLNIAGVLTKPFTALKLRESLSNISHASTEDKKNLANYITEEKKEYRINPVELLRAIKANEFIVYYQPKVFCKNGQLMGFEGLVRWQHHSLGLIYPNEFIPLAESNGLIDLLTETILRQGLLWFSQFNHTYNLKKRKKRLLKLSLNVSAISLKNTQLFEHLLEIFHHLSLAPDCLILELTETAAMEDPVSSLEILTRLRVQGFHLSIDDFGTGYSSMLQLVRLPFSEIKIDKSFVINATYSEESKAVIKSIVDLGKSLKITTTAEGLENYETFTYLKKIGCDLAQGYLISPPLHPDDVMHWLKDYEAKKR